MLEERPPTRPNSRRRVKGKETKYLMGSDRAITPSAFGFTQLSQRVTLRCHITRPDPAHRHIDNILTYYQHPVTNAMSEGLNSQIQKIKSMTCGFRKLESFKMAIYFHWVGLDLYPC
ncbi:MAG TPA: hypothetical protein DD706_24685 [Nitrospiraceae bacterium]|nr:hypothetical protein [Nitrospiraceae bacterium]